LHPYTCMLIKNRKNDNRYLERHRIGKQKIKQICGLMSTAGQRTTSNCKSSRTLGLLFAIHSWLPSYGLIYRKVSLNKIEIFVREFLKIYKISYPLLSSYACTPYFHLMIYGYNRTLMWTISVVNNNPHFPLYSHTHVLYLICILSYD